MTSIELPLAELLSSRREESSKPSLPASIHARILKDNYDVLTKSHDFKPGFENIYKYPQSGRPGVVIEVFDEPMIDPKAESGWLFLRLKASFGSHIQAKLNNTYVTQGLGIQKQSQA